MSKKRSGARRLPRYFKWRAGRPRWEPGPALRAAGHKGRDLKDEAGNWLTMWAACEAADAINAGIEAGDQATTQAPAPRTVNALIDYIEKLPKFRDDGGKQDLQLPALAPGEKPKRTGKRLSRTTLTNYRSHFRIIRAWSGDAPVAALKRGDLELFYDQLVEARGVVMANRIMFTVKMALNIAKDDLEWAAHNRAAKMELLAEDGRLVMWTPEENIAFILCADWMGFEGVGDAHLLALMTAQRRGDILALPELEMDNDVFLVRQRKTGRVAYVPATAPLRARVAMMRKRKAERFPGITYRHEVISSKTGAPYAMDGSTFSDEHRMVRAVASGLQHAIDQAFPNGRPDLDYAGAPFDFVPSIWVKHFQDLRDTAVTLLYEATNGDDAKVANISGHSLATVRSIIDKHYFVRQAGLSRAAGGQLEALMKRIGFAS